MKNNSVIIKKNILIFCVGFTIYMCLEGIFKAFVNDGTAQHFTMGLLGGIVLLAVGSLNSSGWLTWEMPFFLQTFIGSVFITMIEYVSGVILNMWLHLNIWDYSSMPFNFQGQICLIFFFVWLAVAAIAILIDDYARWLFFDEEKPHYKLL